MELCDIRGEGLYLVVTVVAALLVVVAADSKHVKLTVQGGFQDFRARDSASPVQPSTL